MLKGGGEPGTLGLAPQDSTGPPPDSMPLAVPRHFSESLGYETTKATVGNPRVQGIQVAYPGSPVGFLPLGVKATAGKGLPSWSKLS